jgi:hypothetical protein
MAIALRNVTNVDQGSGGALSIVINKPSGTVDGDVLLAVIEYDGRDTVTAPGGWSLLHTANGGAANQKTSVYVKLASGEGASWTWSVASTQIWEGHVSSWTGVDNTTKTEGDVGATGATSTATASTLTPTSSDDLSFVAFTTINSTALSLPASYSNVSSFGSNGDIVRVASLQLASNSATGTTVSNETGTSQWTAHRVLLKTSSTAVILQAPLLRPATMGFRTGLGGLIVGKFQQRIYPQLNSVTIASISGSAIATVTASGALTGTGALSGAAIARTTVTGTTTGTGSLAGAAIARATVSGNGTTLNPISGATIATAIAAGSVVGKGALTGSAIVTVIANGATTGKGALTGAAIVSAITTGTATGKGALSGQAIAGATVSGTVTSASTATQFSGAVICTVTVNGAVAGTGAISGASLARVTVSGATTGKGALAGATIVNVQAVGFVTNVPTPNISGETICTVTVSGTFVNAPQVVSQPPPTGGSGGGLREREQAWQQAHQRIGKGEFTTAGDSVKGKGDVAFESRKALFSIQSPEPSGIGSVTIEGVASFNLPSNRIKARIECVNPINITPISGISFSAVGSVSMEDREEEAVIAAILGYEN